MNCYAQNHELHLWDDAETGEPVFGPATLNGYHVERCEAHLNGWCTVMVYKPDAPNYVVASWTPQNGSSWTWGHYIMNQQDAEQDFYATCLRNCKR